MRKCQFQEFKLCLDQEHILFFFVYAIPIWSFRAQNAQVDIIKRFFSLLSPRSPNKHSPFPAQTTMLLYPYTYLSLPPPLSKASLGYQTKYII